MTEEKLSTFKKITKGSLYTAGSTAILWALYIAKKRSDNDWTKYFGA